MPTGSDKKKTLPQADAKRHMQRPRAHTQVFLPAAGHPGEHIPGGAVVALGAGPDGGLRRGRPAVREALAALVRIRLVDCRPVCARLEETRILYPDKAVLPPGNARPEQGFRDANRAKDHTKTATACRCGFCGPDTRQRLLPLRPFGLAVLPPPGLSFLYPQTGETVNPSRTERAGRRHCP